MAKKWKRVATDKMRAMGDIDYEKKLIRINKAKARATEKQGEILNTIVHEEMHRLHPKMWEKTIKKETKTKIRSMSQKEKNKQYNRYT